MIGVWAGCEWNGYTDSRMREMSWMTMMKADPVHSWFQTRYGEGCIGYAIATSRLGEMRA